MPIILIPFSHRNANERIVDLVQLKLRHLAELNQIYDSKRSQFNYFEALEVIEARKAIINILELP